MSDLFECEGIKPMLIGAEGNAFDSPDYLYELKLDGERCLAYLDPNSVDLRNKRNIKMLPKVPELKDIHKQVRCRCILDGELAIIHNGKPDFFMIQRRSMMTDPLKIQVDSQLHPACFTAFDILYYDNHPVTNLPLVERKKLLNRVLSMETARLAVSRHIETHGIAFYQLAEQQELEGIVAKRKDSKYYFDKRTKDWIKCKYLKDSDYVICGYVRKSGSMTSIVLGQYRGNQLIYKGHVSLGISSESYQRILSIPHTKNPFPDWNENENTVWIQPSLVCTVKYMMKTESGSLRQPVFKGLRNDKLPSECIDVK